MSNQNKLPKFSENFRVNQTPVVFNIDESIRKEIVFLKFVIKTNSNVFEGFVNITGDNEASVQHTQKLVTFIDDKNSETLRLGQVTLFKDRFEVESSVSSCGFNCSVECNPNFEEIRRTLLELMLDRKIFTLSLGKQQQSNKFCTSDLRKPMAVKQISVPIYDEDSEEIPDLISDSGSDSDSQLGPDSESESDSKLDSDELEQTKKFCGKRVPKRKDCESQQRKCKQSQCPYIRNNSVQCEEKKNYFKRMNEDIERKRKNVAEKKLETKETIKDLFSNLFSTIKNPNSEKTKGPVMLNQNPFNQNQIHANPNERFEFKKSEPKKEESNEFKNLFSQITKIINNSLPKQEQVQEQKPSQAYRNLKPGSVYCESGDLNDLKNYFSQREREKDQERENERKKVADNKHVPTNNFIKLFSTKDEEKVKENNRELSNDETLNLILNQLFTDNQDNQNNQNNQNNENQNKQKGLQFLDIFKNNFL